MASANLDSPWGPLWAQWSNGGLEILSFGPGSETEEARQDSLYLTLVDQLSEYFRGERKEFSMPLAPQGTAFQLGVWRQLQTIPWGTTISYRDQSRALGDEKALRAVASANGKNPIAILIPCHRVIGSDGSLTGYAGGLERKRALLVLEGALKAEPKQFEF